jgi:hypothetical protein
MFLGPVAEYGSQPVGYGMPAHATPNQAALSFLDSVQVEEKCFSSTEKSPAGTIFDEISRMEVDFGV